MLGTTHLIVALLIYGTGLSLRNHLGRTAVSLGSPHPRQLYWQPRCITAISITEISSIDSLSGLQRDDDQDRPPVHPAHATAVAHKVVEDGCEFGTHLLKKGKVNLSRLRSIAIFIYATVGSYAYDLC